MPAAKRAVWSPRADQDLREIWRYYTSAASNEIADRLLYDIDSTARRAAERPQASRAGDELIPGLRSILVRPYSLFYRVTGNDIEIVRVLHERRNFPALFPKD